MNPRPSFPGLHLWLLALSLISWCVPVRATEYFFGDYDVVFNRADGSAWATSLDLRLGKFSPGFTPTTDNTSDWLAHWLSGPDGYYAPFDGPEWSAGLVLVDNATFAVSDQLYLWAFDSVSGGTGEWALFTDPTWLVATNSGSDFDFHSFDFTAESLVLLGHLDLTLLTARTATVSAIPEPAAWTVLLGAVALGCGWLRRRTVPGVHR